MGAGETDGQKDDQGDRREGQTNGLTGQMGHPHGESKLMTTQRRY